MDFGLTNLYSDTMTVFRNIAKLSFGFAFEFNRVISLVSLLSCCHLGAVSVTAMFAKQCC